MEFLFRSLLAVGLYCFMIECLDSFVLFFICYLSAAAFLLLLLLLLLPLLCTSRIEVIGSVMSAPIPGKSE